MKRFLAGLLIALLPFTAVASTTIRFQAGVDEQTVTKVIDLIHDAQADSGTQAIVLVINSPGGIVGAGYKLANTIERSHKPVFCIVEEASSIAAYIVQSCHVRIILKNGTIMMHEPYKVVLYSQLASLDVLKRWLADLSADNQIMAAHIAGRMGMSKEAYLARIAKGDWTMNAQEALQNHAVDLVADDLESALKLVDSLTVH